MRSVTGNQGLGHRDPVSSLHQPRHTAPSLQRSEQAQTRETEGIPPSEQVNLSNELSDSLDSQDDHQGLQAMLANLGPVGQTPQLDARMDHKVKEAEGLSEVRNQPGKPKEPRPLREVKRSSHTGTRGKTNHDKTRKLRQMGLGKSPGSKVKPQSSRQVGEAVSSRPGSKGAPKTDAPSPVGRVEKGQPPKSERRVGYRLFSSAQRKPDKIELSRESRDSLANSSSPALAAQPGSTLRGESGKPGPTVASPCGDRPNERVDGELLEVAKVL